LTKATFVVKFSEDLVRFSRGDSHIMKNALSRNVEESFKKILDLYQEAHNYQNLTYLS